VQARSEDAAQALGQDAKALAAAGAALLVIEMVPATVARDVTAELPIPVIGIGAGSGCSGQVLVLHDMLGLSFGKPHRFVADFLEGAGSIERAVRKYVSDVKSGRFPDDRLHGF
jgi:3-methyl-2-oxobutanoate hydroxymethyltransferase